MTVVFAAKTDLSQYIRLIEKKQLSCPFFLQHFPRLKSLSSTAREKIFFALPSTCDFVTF